VVAALIAVLVGLAVGYRVGFPPKLESRQYTVGIASLTALVDTPSSQVVDLGGKAAPDTLTVTGLPASRIADLIAERGLRLHELAPQHVALEEAYMELTKDAVDYQARGGTDRAIRP